MARYPLNPPLRITTQFGVPDSKAKFGKHAGLDMACALNTLVYAPVTGTVTFAGWSKTGGNMVQIFDGKYYHRLMHNNSMSVKEGQRVTGGDQIAKAGTTGLSTGVHVHWDVSPTSSPKSFNFINPATLISEEKEEDMFKLTREQIDAISRMATGSYPGSGFNYSKFTSQPASQGLIDELIQAFAPYSEKRIQEYASLQKTVSELSSGSDAAKKLAQIKQIIG